LPFVFTLDKGMITDLYTASMTKAVFENDNLAWGIVAH
jgi:hypothetical protein